MKNAVNAGKPIWDITSDTRVLNQLPPAAQKGIENLRAIQMTYHPLLASGEEMAAKVEQLIAHLRYDDEVSRLYPDPEEQAARRSTIQELVNAVAQYEADNDHPTLHHFLSEVTLAGREFGSPKEKQLQQNAISLMTFHSAKGLEFPYVYMVGMEEGILPHRKSIGDAEETVDEERRLCYVGVTRAQDELTLSLALARFKWGKPRPTFPSRFRTN